MKRLTFLLLIVVFASCNSFDRMKYRHLNKVPATPQQYVTVTKPVYTPEIPEHKPATSVTQPEPVTDTLSHVSVCIETESEIQPTIFPQEQTGKECMIPDHKPVRVSMIKHDWSLLIGTILIIGGMYSFAVCLLLPFSGFNFLFILFFEVFCAYLAWRLLATGITFFITRFGKRKNYKEV